MPRSSVAPLCAVLGGALWSLPWLLGTAAPHAPTFYWAGLALVLLAAAAGSAGLVTGDVLPLRVLVAVAAPLLTWSVIEFFRPDRTGWYVASWGAVAVAAGTWRLWRDRGSLRRRPAPSRPEPTRRAPARRAQARGAHAR